MKKNLSLAATITIFLGFLWVITYFYRSQDTSNRQTLSIYVPCGMTLPFKELAMSFEKANRQTKVEANFDNTVVLTNYILKKGKRPDIFISPGEKEIGALKKSGLIEENSIRTFGNYELILIAPAESDLSSLDDIFKNSVKTIAIANPDFNSVGDYAVASLKNLGIWDRLQKSKTVIFTNTPIEALSFIASKKADAGIHYNVCPFETDSGKVSQGAIKIIERIPNQPGINLSNYIAILNSSKNKKAAQSFIDYLFSPRGQKILEAYGLAGSSGKNKLSAQAKIKVNIQAYYPFNDEHLYIKEYLETLPAKFSGVKVECIDFRNDSGYVLWRKTGLSCGGILINGKSKFKLSKEGKEKEVEFLKKIDLFWTKEDLEAAIKQELAK